MWQSLLSAFVLVIYVIVVVALLRNPGSGLRCSSCSSVSCVDMLGWSCAESRHNQDVCEFSAFSNATLAVRCYDDDSTESRLAKTYNVGAVSITELRGWCSNVCAQASPPPAWATSAPPGMPAGPFA